MGAPPPPPKKKKKKKLNKTKQIRGSQPLHALVPKISLEHVEEEGTESNSSTNDDEMERSSNILEFDRWFTFLAGTTTRFCTPSQNDNRLVTKGY